jgi:hypothetical protein
MTVSKLAAYFFGTLIVCLFVFLKYLHAKLREDRRTRKSGIQRLFSNDD